jgi:predicted RNA-binding protein YlqC (UPF0109 family)
MNEDGLTEITKRLDAIIGILINTLNAAENPKSLSDQVRLLQLARLGPTDIGRIVGRKAKEITSLQAKMKTVKKGK